MLNLHCGYRYGKACGGVLGLCHKANQDGTVSYVDGKQVKIKAEDGYEKTYQLKVLIEQTKIRWFISDPR